MDFDQFNKVRVEVLELLAKATSRPTESNIADLYMGIALRGLAVIPVDLEKDTMPKPICGFISIRGTDGKVITYYLFPANQELP